MITIESARKEDLSLRPACWRYPSLSEGNFTVVYLQKESYIGESDALHGIAGSLHVLRPNDGTNTFVNCDQSYWSVLRGLASFCTGYLHDEMEDLLLYQECITSITSI